MNRYCSVLGSGHERSRFVVSDVIAVEEFDVAARLGVDCSFNDLSWLSNSYQFILFAFSDFYRLLLISYEFSLCYLCWRHLHLPVISRPEFSSHRDYILNDYYTPSNFSLLNASTVFSARYLSQLCLVCISPLFGLIYWFIILLLHITFPSFPF